MLKSLLVGLLILFLGCSEKAEEISKRSSDSDLQSGGGPAEPDEPQDQSQNTIFDEEVVNFSSIALLGAANFDQYSPDDFANISLVSKVDANTIVLFGKNGLAWSYGVEGEPALVDHLPYIQKTEDRDMYTLPGDDFWLVSADRVSRRKFVADAPENQIFLHNFDLTKLSGNPAARRVLGATKEALIVHLESHIAIFTVADGLTAAFEFKAELPPQASGDVIAAGQTDDGGYWFATSDKKFALLKQEGAVWSWSIADVPMTDLTGTISSLAVWLSVGNQSASGDAAVLTNDSLYSVSGSPIAVAP